MYPEYSSRNSIFFPTFNFTGGKQIIQGQKIISNFTVILIKRNFLFLSVGCKRIALSLKICLKLKSGLKKSWRKLKN